MYGRKGEVVVFTPNRGVAVVKHCRKCTMGHHVWRGSRPWPCGDRAGVLAAPAGGMVAPVEGTSPKRGVAAFRGSYRSGS